MAKPNPDIGTRHSEIPAKVRNPFRSDFMRRNFDAAIKTYSEKHPDFISPHGIRCQGNAWATHFWRGFDGNVMDYTGMKDSSAYAMYRAGQEVGKVERDTR